MRKIQYRTQTVAILAQKITNGEQAIQNIDMLMEVMRDDTERILRKIGVKIYDYYTFYSEGAQKLKYQLTEKNHIKGTQELKQLEGEKALKVFLRKLTANVRNEYTIDRSGSLAGKLQQAQDELLYMQKEREIDDNSVINMLIAQEELQKLKQTPADELIPHLRKIWNESHFEPNFYSEMCKLCTKYGINVHDVVPNTNSYPVSTQKNENGNEQTILIFD